METTDITLQLLRDIRDSIDKLGARIEETYARLDSTLARLDTTLRFDGIDGRFTHMEIYLGGEMVALRREVSRVLSSEIG